MESILRDECAGGSCVFVASEFGSFVESESWGSSGERRPERRIRMIEIGVLLSGGHSSGENQTHYSDTLGLEVLRRAEICCGL